MIKTIKSITIAGVMSVLAFGSTSSFAYSTSCPDGGAGPLNGCVLPGVVNGSYPYVDNGVTFDYNGKKLNKKGYFDIKAKSVNKAVGTFAVGQSEQYDIENFNFKLKTRAYEDGSAEGGLKISGKIDGQNIKITADLNPDKKTPGVWDSSEDGTLWGFNTYNIECKGLEAYANCTKNEVVFLNLFSAIGPASGFSKISTVGTAVTSVPLPAAAWLLGSGLLALITVSRRRGQRT
jgi:hypothetical protein